MARIACPRSSGEIHDLGGTHLRDALISYSGEAAGILELHQGEGNGAQDRLFIRDQSEFCHEIEGHPGYWRDAGQGVETLAQAIREAPHLQWWIHVY